MCIKFVAVCSPINDCHSTRLRPCRNFNYAGRRLFDGFLRDTEPIQRKIKQLRPRPRSEAPFFFPFPFFFSFFSFFLLFFFDRSSENTRKALLMDFIIRIIQR